MLVRCKPVGPMVEFQLYITCLYVDNLQLAVLLSAASLVVKLVILHLRTFSCMQTDLVCNVAEGIDGYFEPSCVGAWLANFTAYAMSWRSLIGTLNLYLQYYCYGCGFNVSKFKEKSI